MIFDKSLLTPCPVLQPSMLEFENPMAYFSRSDIAELGSEYGILKIVPPLGWKPPFSISSSFKFHTRLQKISDLGLTTRSRAFFKNNINRFLKMRNRRPIRLYFSVGGARGQNQSDGGIEHEPVDEDEHADESSGSKRKRGIRVYYYDLYVAVDKAGGVAKMTEETWKEMNLKFGLPEKSSKLEEEYDANIKAYALFLSNNNIKKYNFNRHPHSHESSSSGTKSSEVNENSHTERKRDEEDEDASADNCVICSKNDNPSETLLCDNCDEPHHMGCLEPKLKEVPSGSWYCDKCLIGTGEYGFKEDVDLKYTLPEFFQMCQDFDKEFSEEYNNGQPLTIDFIERKFWEFVEEEKSDLEVKYGADIHNLTPGEISGFPMANTPGIPINDLFYQLYINHPFNLTKLPFSEGSLMKFINTSISGMTIPWIYIGSLLSTFCWHVEDHYTLSINYCHFGATKKWYGIPSSDAEKFERLMKDSAPDLFQRQPDLLHQLVTLMSPMRLVENGIRCVYADQQPNEFIITYPKVYHSGFNCGFNFNEAVNFTIEPWLEFGEQAIQDYKEIKKENVFNHYQLLENVLRKFISEKNTYVNGTREHYYNKDFVKRCLKSFEKHHSEQLNSIWDLNQKRYSIQYKLRDFKKRSFIDEQNGVFSAEGENGDGDELLCDGCKTHLAYQYFSVPNKEQQFTKRKQEREDELEAANSAAIAIKATVEVPIAAIKPSTTSYLPTPKSSPQEKFSIKEGSVEVELNQIKDSDSSRKMSLLTAGPEDSTKLSEEEEFKQLIKSAKRKSESPEERSDSPAPQKRRRSTRIQKQEQTEIASIGSSKKVLQMVHENMQLNLCAECIKVYNKDLPLGTTLIYESNPEDIQKLIYTVHRELLKN